MATDKWVNPLCVTLSTPLSLLLSGPPASDVMQGNPISTLPPDVEKSTIYHFNLGAIYHNARSPQWAISTSMSIVEIMSVFFCDFSGFFLLYRHYWWIRVKMADPLPLSIHPLQYLEYTSYDSWFSFSVFLVLAVSNTGFTLLFFFCHFLKLLIFFSVLQDADFIC